MSDDRCVTASLKSWTAILSRVTELEAQVGAVKGLVTENELLKEEVSRLQAENAKFKELAEKQLAALRAGMAEMREGER